MDIAVVVNQSALGSGACILRGHEVDYSVVDLPAAMILPKLKSWVASMDV